MTPKTTLPTAIEGTLVDPVGGPVGKRRKRGGSRKGIPNKLTADVRALVITALERAGGVDYLVQQAHDNPPAFLALVAKIIPKEITGPGGGPLQTNVRIRVSWTDPADVGATTLRGGPDERKKIAP